MEKELNSIEVKLEVAYKDFFDKVVVNPNTGLINELWKDKQIKFPVYPYIGLEYGKTKKILFVAHDKGEDTCEGIQGFETRRKRVKDSLMEHPRTQLIPGTMVCALHFLSEKEKKPEWEAAWKRIKDIHCKAFSSIVKEEKIFGDNNPIKCVALTNYYKFIHTKRKGYGNQSIRYKMNEQIDLLIKEIEILEPDMIIFQYPKFRKKYENNYRKLKEKISKTGFAQKIYVGYHPSYRKEKNPQNFVDNIKPLVKPGAL